MVVLVCVLFYILFEGGCLGEIVCECFKVMVEINDGFEIVCCDLEICGLGEFLGVC